MRSAWLDGVPELVFSKMKLIIPRELEPGWPEHGFTGYGKPIRMADAIKLSDGQLQMVYFTGPDGGPIWPWKNAGYYVDDDGEVIVPVGTPMLRSQLRRSGIRTKSSMPSTGATSRNRRT